MVDSVEALKIRASGLPRQSGVYLMRDEAGTVIYVGKAVDLRQRVRSYFRSRGQTTKTESLVHRVRQIDHVVTDSEAEALILEANLIKRHQPYYNISLRDDKMYPLIEVTGEEFPRAMIVRPRTRAGSSFYYGPYTSPRLIREALGILRRIFPFRSCDPIPDRACLDFHLGLCGAPCIGVQTRAEYQRNIRHIRWILEGKRDRLSRLLERQMERASQSRDYEAAAKYRDQLRALGALFSSSGGEGADADLNYFKEAEQLQRLLGLVYPPRRIETFDISTMMGDHSVGAMVSFLNGRPDKAQYRRYKIRTIDGIDDVRMIAEVVRRRYGRLKRERKVFPDLIVIDGGKGQLASAVEALEDVGAEIPVVSLAKQHEEIFVPGRAAPVVLPARSLGLQLLQRCRDEAHRFAVAYHRVLRGRAFVGVQKRQGMRRRMGRG